MVDEIKGEKSQFVREFVCVSMLLFAEGNERKIYRQMFTL